MRIKYFYSYVYYMYKNIEKYLSETSKIKLQNLPLNPDLLPTLNLNPKLIKLLDRMKHAFVSELNISQILENNKLSQTKKTFSDFIHDVLDVTDSKFEHDLSEMNGYTGINLYIRNQTITLNFIYDPIKNTSYVTDIAVIVHAVNT